MAKTCLRSASYATSTATAAIAYSFEDRDEAADDHRGHREQIEGEEHEQEPSSVGDDLVEAPEGRPQRFVVFAQQLPWSDDFFDSTKQAAQKPYGHEESEHGRGELREGERRADPRIRGDARAERHRVGPRAHAARGKPRIGCEDDDREENARDDENVPRADPDPAARLRQRTAPHCSRTPERAGRQHIGYSCRGQHEGQVEGGHHES